ncbi:mitochondrial ribosomal subunit protein-domain-containing protein [Dioszegia hungarica]|uniref:Mitochondrial ribosomal subunit protein-domain-containing protein n=1 Tax=Dioszegia hungarica TaxID=4972 RepID=A0AA38LVD6_9TREE|nr:mitochondrial ribosomal subunit protein-domain-containing protein [Dioszegia hungarica]KAI9637110.1 mitochondrial ribosomal subunit protein-domain-containing protein [Dioszegia hungarica]
MAFSSVRTARATVSLARSFSSSASSSAEAPAASASKRPVTRRQPLREFNMSGLDEFQFDDATSLGFMRLEKIREAQEIIRRVEVDRPSLQAQRKPFTPPSAPIRISQTIDLSNPQSLVHRKRVLLAPVAKLPLSGPEAIHRFKLLAGPRWTIGRPGRMEVTEEDGEGKEGWIKISEEKFPDGLMNRKSAGDMLERLLAAANDANSPLPADTPLDPRPLLARQRKRADRSALRQAQRSGSGRVESVGNVPGFPKEWLQGDRKVVKDEAKQ